MKKLNYYKSNLEDVIESLYYTDILKVGSVAITNSKILSKLHLINKNNLIWLPLILYSILKKRFLGVLFVM